MSSDADPRRFREFHSLKGPDEVILGAELGDLSVAVKFPRGETPRDGELPEILQDAGKELDHYAAVRGLVEPKDVDNVESEPEIVPDGGTIPADDPAERLQEISEEFEIVEEQLAPVERDPHRVFSSVCGELAVLCSDMAETLNDATSSGDDYRLDDDQVLTDGGFPQAGLQSVSQTITSASSSPERILTVAFALAVAIHGPLDVGLTAAAWHLETNPAVLELGFWPWTAVKIAALAVVTFIWWDAPRPSTSSYVPAGIAGLGVVAGFGLALVYLNLVLLAGVIL